MSKHLAMILFRKSVDIQWNTFLPVIARSPESFRDDVAISDGDWDCFACARNDCGSLSTYLRRGPIKKVNEDESDVSQHLPQRIFSSRNYLDYTWF